jgi:hypothetical protein
LVAGAALLQACATNTCNDATILALTPLEEVPHVKAPADSTPHVLDMELPAQVGVALRPCPDAAMAGHMPGTLCLEVTAPPQARLRFTSDRFELVSDSGAATTTLLASAFAYQGTCATRNGVRKCLGMLEPVSLPDDEDEAKARAGGGLGYEYITRTFPFQGEFSGAERSFLATVSPQSLLGTPPSRLRLPSLVVNGQEVAFPLVRLATRTERLCT